jgi:hypothetical protein
MHVKPFGISKGFAILFIKVIRGIVTAHAVLNHYLANVMSDK